jgi:hypothetical protein
MEIEDIHKNAKLLIDGIPYNVDEAEFMKPGKGRAIYRLKLRNLLDGSTVDRKEYGQQIAMPQKFLEAIAHLPECGGAALGVDRLVMLLCNAESIDEVIAFTVDTA